MDFILQTEAGLIPSEFILRPVIEKLDLNTVWAKRYNDGQKFKTMETCDLLKTRLKAAPVPGSALIQIDVTQEDAGESVTLANAIARSYCDYRADRRRRIVETALNHVAEHSRIPLENLTATRTQLESALAGLPAEWRAQPPERKTGRDIQLEGARARYNQATVQLMARSNQLTVAAAGATTDTNLIARLNADVARLQAERAAAESEIRSDSRKQEALNAYWTARDNFESAERTFAPFKKAAEEARAMAPDSNKPPAIIEDPAERAVTVESRDLSRGASGFGIGGVLLAGGVGVLLSRRPARVEEIKQPRE
jgi:hypothetical protein